MKSKRRRLLSIVLALTFTITLSATLNRGVTASAADTGTYNHYYGMLHGHSTVSDGHGTPAEAYTFARDQIGFDFFGLSDHNSYFKKSDDYTKYRAIADSFNKDGKFITIPGFEMTWPGNSGWWGHMNTFNTSWVDTDIQLATILMPDKYYDLLADYPDSFSQFNHPGFNWGEFDDFNFRTDANDAVIDLFELRTTDYEDAYIRCLDKGWHVSPMNNDDNHSATWGVNGEAGVIMAKSLTRKDLIAAIKANRTYSVQDKDLQIDFRGNNAVMGSRLSGIDSLTLNVKVKFSSAVGKISILSNGGRIVAEKEFGTNTADWSLDVPVGDGIYYVAKVMTASFKYGMTAPIWVENGSGLTISDQDVGVIKTNYATPYEVKFNLTNTSDRTVSETSVELYRGNRKEGDTYLLPSLAAGETKEIRLPAAYVKNQQDVYIAVQGSEGAATVGTSGTIRLPDLIMTEFLAACDSETTPKNAFSYLEIYNASPVAKNLMDYSLSYFTQRDTLVDYDIYDNVTVPPYGTAVVWLKDDSSEAISALTKEDFCSFFNNTIDPSQVADTSFTVNETYSASNKLPHGFFLENDEGDRLQFMRYNSGYELGQNVAQNTSVSFVYAKDGFSLATILENTTTLTPGQVTASQIPYTASEPGAITLTGSDTKISAADLTAAASTATTSLKAYIDSTSKDVSVTVENEALSQITSNPFTIDSEVGGVIISQAAASALSSAAAGGDVTFEFKKSTADGKETFALSMSTAGSAITDLSAPVVLMLPYTGSADENAAVIETSDAAPIVQSVYSASTNSLLTKVTSSGVFTVASGEVSFSDTSSNWAESYITFLAARNVVGGFSGKFNPAGEITHAEFTKILAVTAGADVRGYTSSAFEDVAANAWYMPYVSWAADKGIVTGRGEGRFDPNGKITREELAVMLSRLADNVLQYGLAESDNAAFSDDAEIGSYARDAVYYMKAEGILSGKPNNKFDPKGSATRAEAAKMITVLLRNIVLK